MLTLPAHSASAFFFKTDYERALVYVIVVFLVVANLVAWLLVVRVVYTLFFKRHEQPILSQRTQALQRRLNIVTVVQVNLLSTIINLKNKYFSASQEASRLTHKEFN